MILMNNVERKFQQWSKKLYDISKKNYMINFTGQHYRSVRLTSPSMEKLYELLVVNEKSLTFKRNISVEAAVQPTMLFIIDKQVIRSALIFYQPVRQR